MLRLTSNVISWGSRVTQSWGARFIIREAQVLTSEELVRRVFQPMEKRRVQPAPACVESVIQSSPTEHRNARRTAWASRSGLHAISLARNSSDSRHSKGPV